MLVSAVSAQSAYSLTLVTMIVGLVIAVFGHITRSRLTIGVGLVLIGGVSAYFTFVLSRVT